ncbi:NAD(+) diphosphatase [Acidocella sp.]|uniref:NAD(+) diphosphatase n=1 Tax=Acidocella sp. TaxID=50710 RepID=UPI00263283DA|nr:NAD(+) diphosphatase [Acidocella sp.]
MRHIIPARPNPYSGGALDRAAQLREDDDFLARAVNDPAARVTYVWQGKALLTGGETPAAQLLPLAGLAPALFLGLYRDAPLFAHDLSAQPEQPDFGCGEFSDLRGLASLLPPDDAAILATARGMLHWHATHRFCPACGNALAPLRAGWVLHCTGCDRDQFPRTDAAVIMLITRGEFLLLGQSHRFPPERNFYSTLAGFVEPGEALEDAVRREVFEEVGVRVGKVAYHSSQPWPFPASLMLGYYGEALSEEIVLQESEMRDAKWFTAADIANRHALGFDLPPRDSIARALIDDWLAAHA